MAPIDPETRWNSNCEALAHSGNTGTRLALALDPECGMTALHFMADHDVDAEVRSAAVETLAKRERRYEQLFLFGDAA